MLSPYKLSHRLQRHIKVCMDADFRLLGDKARGNSGEIDRKNAQDTSIAASAKEGVLK
jgi:hypothetical protein